MDLTKAKRFGAFFLSGSGVEDEEEEAKEDVNEIQRGDCVIATHDFTPPSSETKTTTEEEGEKEKEEGESWRRGKLNILSFKKGDVLQVYDNMSSDEWWRGAIVNITPEGFIHEEMGFFPKSYVTTPRNFQDNLNPRVQQQHYPGAATPPEPKMASALHSTSQYPSQFECPAGEPRVSQSGAFVFNLGNNNVNQSTALNHHHLRMLKKYLAYDVHLHPVLRKNLLDYVNSGFLPYYLMTQFVDSDLHTMELVLKEIRFVPGSNPAVSALPQEAERQSSIQLPPKKAMTMLEGHLHPQFMKLGAIVGASHLLPELKQHHKRKKNIKKGTMPPKWRTALKREIEKRIQDGGVMEGLDAYLAAFEMTLCSGETIEDLDFNLAEKLSDAVAFNPVVWMLMFNDRWDLQLNGIFRRLLEGDSGERDRQLRLMAHEGAMWHRANCLPESLTFYLNALSEKPEWGFLVHSCGWSLLGLGNPALAWEYFQLAKSMGVKTNEVRDFERGVEYIAPDFF
uniref:SH3 domain-containing protein n=1 Tax=Paramoeba aestuarina TaxID=180227 RepID=A0A7S4P8P4_9EUKA